MERGKVEYFNLKINVPNPEPSPRSGDSMGTYYEGKRYTHGLG